MCSHRLLPLLNPRTIVSLLGALMIGGCATSTVETRKQERYSAYTALTPDTRRMVDEGKIQVGMTQDAVYIAWGKPAQVLEQHTSGGAITTWLYESTHMDEHRYWSYRTVYSGNRYYHEPYLAHEYVPRSFIEAEVRFENGVVRDWQTFPRPIR